MHGDNCGCNKPSDEYWTYLSLCVGYNELARQAGDDLASKTFFRMVRDHAFTQFKLHGGDPGMFGPAGEIVLTIRDAGITFRASDIELMRKTVADYDNAHKVQ